MKVAIFILLKLRHVAIQSLVYISTVESGDKTFIHNWPYTKSQSFKFIMHLPFTHLLFYLLKHGRMKEMKLLLWQPEWWKKSK